MHAPVGKLKDMKKAFDFVDQYLTVEFKMGRRFTNDSEFAKIKFTQTQRKVFCEQLLMNNNMISGHVYVNFFPENVLLWYMDR